MRFLCPTIAFLLIFTTLVSVNGECLVPGCKALNAIFVNNRCRERIGRSAASEGCYGVSKLYLNDGIFSHPDGWSYTCPERYVIDENMRCSREGWEPGSTAWETHHFQVAGRRLVLEIKQSDWSLRCRSVILGGG